MEGRLDSKISEGGSCSIKLINDSYTLWSHLTSQEPCPPQVPFSITLPSTFQDGNNSFSLPPSYHFFRQVVLSLLVRSTYQLHFIVTRVRHQKLDIWPKKQQYVYFLTLVCPPFIYMPYIFVSTIIPFKYVPRTRAPRPIVATPCLFSTVKTSPEEWHQAVTCLNIRPNAAISPITCNVCCFSSPPDSTSQSHFSTVLHSRWSNIWSYRHHKFPRTTGWSDMFPV